MRARPSFAVQSAASSRGSVARVTGPACNSARVWSSMTLSGVTTDAAAAARMSGVAACRRSSASARRRAATAAESVASAATWRNEAAVDARLCCISESDGGASGATSRMGLSRIAASPINASFSFCCTGMKLFNVMTRDTSGRASRRRTSGSDAASDGARTLTASGVQSGSVASASRVAIDSTLELLRLKGLKSKRTSGSSAHEPTAATSATTSTARRRRCMRASTGAQHREADLGHAVGWRAQQHQQRGQQHDAQGEGHDHAETRDGSQFGQADIAGRKEGKEAGADGGGRQRQRLPDAAAGLGQRCPQIRMHQSLGQAADAELDAEVDAKPDEQRDEGDRDQVEAANRQQTDGSREDQADKRGGEDCNDDTRGAHRQPQDSQERDKHGSEEQVRVLGQRRELLVRQRHRSGQAHGHAMRRIQAKRPGRRADGFARGRAGLQRPIIHHRLDQNDVPCLAGPGRRPGDERAPREEGWLARRYLFECLGERRHRGFYVVELGLAVFDTLQDIRDGGQDTPQTGVGGERGKHRLGALEPFRGRRDVFQRAQQQPVAVEKRPAVGAVHRVEKAGLSRSASASRPAAASASSGVAPSTTTMVRLSNCGNAASNASPCCRHFNFFEINSSVLAVMAKCCVV